MTNKKPILSICIPVYNCAEYLEQALNAIMKQSIDNIEVIVYDGASTDHTSLLMSDYTNSWPFIKYYRAEKRGGIDADMASCVSMANANYCWLFSGDDVMRQGSISQVLTEIESSHDVYVCKHTICNKNMELLHEHAVLNTDSPVEADFSIAEKRLKWFASAATTEAFFSFMSSLIIKKSTWDSGTLIPKFDGSCWAHVARLFDISKTGLKVKYIPKILLDQRGDNDSFADRGVVNRYRIGIEGYHNLANHFYGAESSEAFHIRRVIRNEFKLQSFLSAKIQTVRNPIKESSPLLDQLIKTAYGDKSLKNSLVIFLYKMFPYSIFLMARYFYRCYKKLNLRIKNA
ncbi:MAG: glycosyltransferase family 2 protein [Methylotenera sp.]|nr:glycosyltransferase family 2 protein [Methylotenera sp.]MDP3060376.1 glycosyltransferase family 2 protein [Methylotenera sp.]